MFSIEDDFIDESGNFICESVLSLKDIISIDSLKTIDRDRVSQQLDIHAGSVVSTIDQQPCLAVSMWARVPVSYSGPICLSQVCMIEDGASGWYALHTGEVLQVSFCLSVDW